MERSVLGKGLSALIPEGAPQGERIQNIAVEKIEASTYQPRTKFSDGKLKELADSIREKGVIQPILLRAKGDKFEIIAGERRFRAALLNELTQVPAIVKSVKDEDLLEISLIENIQREELSSIEEARAYERLVAEFQLTHEMISKKVSKDRATITNLLRLLELPAEIQALLENQEISQGHAKALLSIAETKKQIKLCRRVVRKGLSVRETENQVRKMGLKGQRKSRGQKDIHVAAVEDNLQHHLGTRVQIVQGKKRGKIVIDYYSQDDLNRLLTILVPKS